MGFRFRKTFRILPGLRFNLSKTGLSASVGKAGATVNIGERGVRSTVGLPGSGMSYSEKISTGKGSRSIIGWLVLAAVIAVWAFSHL